jgi:hypothetical protein
MLLLRHARYLLPGCLGAMLALVACTATKNQPAGSAASAPPTTDILLVGSNHLSQLYKADNPHSDVLTPKRQAELGAVLNGLQRFRPDGIMVEEVPENQPRIDSLYQLYRQGKLDLNTLSGGRSEVYQLGFALGKRLGLPRIHCANAPGGTSQSILNQGDNIALYEQATTRWRTQVARVDKELLAGNATMAQYMCTLNNPTLVKQLHTLVYNVPARVTNGTLKPDAMVDAAFINPKYVGAEFISVLYNRDLKVYSNIVTTQLATQQVRQLVIIGVRHVGSLKGIFREDPAYRVVEAAPYL